MRLLILIFQIVNFQLLVSGQNNDDIKTSNVDKSQNRKKNSLNNYNDYNAISKEKIDVTNFADHFLKSKSTYIPKENNKTSLVIVFDATGSMSDDLREVINGTTSIINAMNSQENPPIENYILVPFRDPIFGPMTVTKNETVFKEALKNISIYGGFDCPEYSISALKAALNASLPYSYVYLFTDASAKDHFLVKDVLELIQRKKSQVVFVLTGDCNDRNQSSYLVYEQIAKASSGQVFRLNKNEIFRVLKFVEDTMDLNRVNLGLVLNKNGGTHKHDITVDSTLEKVTVSISGGNTKLQIKNPQGEIVDGPPKIYKLLDLSELQIINIVNPEPGNWTFNILNDKSHSVKLTGVSKIKFDHGFFINETNKIRETSNRPLQGTLSHLLIEVKNSGEEIQNVESVDIIDASGKHLFQVPLLRINDTNQLIYKTDAFIPPDDFFYIAINGIDVQGNLFRRISSTAIQPQAAEKPFISGIDKINASLHSSITLVCKIESLVPFMVWWFKNNTLIQDKQQFPQSAEIEYTISDVDNSSEGTYTCKASNTAGVSSKHTNVIIKEKPPVIKFKTEAPVVLSKTEFSLECIVESDMPIQSVKFYASYESESSKLLNPLNIVHVNDRITTYKYISNNVENSGFYECEAINERGITKQNLTITVIPLINVEILNSTVEYEKNDNVNISCMIHGSKNGKWLLPTDSTSQNKNIITKINEDESYELILNIKNASIVDEGIYTCSAFYDELYDFSSVNMSIKLQMIEIVKVSVGQKNVLAHIGEKVILDCKANGIPKPDIKWFKESQADINESENVYLSDDENIVIVNTTLDDEGNYVCKGENGYSYSEEKVELKVWKKLHFIEKLEDTTGYIDEPLQISCHVDGIPFPRVRWYRNDRLIQYPNVSKNGQTLHFDKLKWEHGGKYTCVAVNDLESIEDEAILEVTGDLPKISLSPLNNTYPLGKLIKINCMVESKLPINKILIYYSSQNSIKENMMVNNITIGSTTTFFTQSFILTEKTKGIYSCEAVNYAGQNMESIFIDILPPLIVNITPEFIDFEDNDEIKFTCSIQGSIFGSWIISNIEHVEKKIKQIEKVNSVGDLLLEFVLPNGSKLNEGNYVCLGFRGEGDEKETISSVAKANFVKKPTFISYPSNITTEVGLTVVLKCETDSIPEASVHWILPNNTIITSDDYKQKIYINSQSQLVLQNVTTFDQGRYKCTAENRLGNVEGEIYLSIWMKPFLEKIAENKTVVIYQSSNITCAIGGIPRPEVIWFHNNTQIVNEKITNGTLNIDKANISSKGKYSCIGTNEYGSIQNEFYIDIIGLERPLLSIDEPHKVVKEGNTIEFVCRINEGKPIPTLIWQKNSLALNNNVLNKNEISRFKIANDINGSVLTIENVLRIDDGNYTCLATNDLGNDSFTTYLEIQYPPYFSKENMAKHSLVEVISGNKINLQCEMFGNPTPEIIWLKNNKLIELNGNYQNLVLSNLKRNDSGNFTCIGQNMLGNISKQFFLDVLDPPIISNVLPNSTIVAVEGQLVKLPCFADGNPIPNVNWSNNKIEINNIKDIQIDTNNTLMFVANRSLNSIFKCEAVNKIGNDSILYFVSVYQPPTINPDETEISRFSLGSTASINCEATGFPPPTITWRWKGYKLNNSQGVIIDNGYLSIENITHENSGVYLCNAQNDAGIKEKEYNIIILEQPKLLSNDLPTKINLQSGDEEFSIPCKAIGNPPPKVFWKYNNQIIINDDLKPNVEIKNDGTLYLKYINEALSGIYECIAENSEGSTHREYSVSVLVPPAFENQFDEKIYVLEGSNATINCPLKLSKIIPTVEWYKQKESSLNLITENENKTSLKLFNISRNNATNIICKVSNALGSISTEFQLFVRWPPILSVEKEIHDILQGDPLNLNCTMDANPSPKYQWLKDLKPFGEITNSIKRPNAKVHHTGEYICIASNLMGKATKKFSVHVSTPPQIKGESTNKIEALIEEPLILECLANGVPKPTIEWNIIYPPDWTEIENGSYLKTNNISVNSEGLYSCEAKNYKGVAKKIFHVDILQNPLINEIKLSSEENIIEISSNNIYYLKEYSYNSFFCHSHGKPKPDVIWLKNGNIHNETSELFFQNITINDSGKYTCMASNKVGIDEFDIIINVLAAPKIHSHSMYRLNKGNSILTPVEYQFISLNCYASGNPKPDIYWIKDGNFIEFYDPNIVKENFGQVLLIRKIKRNGSGNYVCIAKNSEGEDRTTFQVDVLYPPSMNDNYFNNQKTITEEGQSIKFQCPINGNPKPEVKWLKNPYSIITENEYPNILIENNNSSLIINNITLLDQGNYSCILTNMVGMAEIKYSLEVTGLPKIDPQLDKLYNKFDKNDVIVKIRRSFHLYCNALSNKYMEILWFKDDKLLRNNAEKNIFISSDGQILNIFDSYLNDTGKYVCIAKNKAGQAENTFNVRIVVPAQWSLWSQWTHCNQSCGLGYKRRTRICQYFGDMNFTLIDKTDVLNTPNFNFNTNKLWLPDNALDKSACEGDSTESMACFNVPCKVDGGWSAWSDWSKCSVKCGLGIQKRHRACNNPIPKYGGKPCKDNNIDKRDCEGNDCSLWLPWSQWSSCSVTCGKGIMKRFRKCDGPNDTCFGNFSETAECVFSDCSESVWSSWSEWSSCSVTCGVGYRKRIRQCDVLYSYQKPQNCKGSDIQMERCRNPLACGESKIDNFAGKINQPPAKDISNIINLIPQNTDERYINKDFLLSESEVLKRLPYMKFTKFKENGSERGNTESYSHEKIETSEVSSEYSIENSYDEYCQDGFFYDIEYHACYDINECELEYNKCHSTQMCKNTPGSFQCLCERGYVSLGNRKRCLDINECSQNVHRCSHECYNIPGSYICKCPISHILSSDQRTCVLPNTIDRKDPRARITIGD